MKTVAERVQAGMDLLDLHEQGWESCIDLQVLDIFCGELCTLGQLFGSYELGKLKLDLSYGNAISLGFMYSDFGYSDLDIGDARMLTDEWKARIRERREGQ